jgi:hypothetical protein
MDLTMKHFFEGILDQASMLESWRQDAIDLGFTDFFSAEDGFKSRNGKAWDYAKSIGIYFWIAENGEAYIGQTIQLRRRLSQHWAVHLDIIEAAFQRVNARELDYVECDLIKRAGKLYPTRNIKYAIATASHLPLDQCFYAT